ncbi:MAG: YlxR family protein [Actinomycetota bacterium]|nr:YlxR family protein [Actinomycetota bacterium]
MSLKKQPLRRCIACYKSFPKRDLKRVVCTKDGDIRVDPTGREAGRGAYFCSMKCFEEAAKKKRIGAALKTAVDRDLIESLGLSLAEIFAQES